MRERLDERRHLARVAERRVALVNDDGYTQGFHLLKEGIQALPGLERHVAVTCRVKLDRPEVTASYQLAHHLDRPADIEQRIRHETAGETVRVFLDLLLDVAVVVRGVSEACRRDHRLYERPVDASRTTSDLERSVHQTQQHVRVENGGTEAGVVGFARDVNVAVDDQFIHPLRQSADRCRRTDQAPSDLQRWRSPCRRGRRRICRRNRRRAGESRRTSLQ